jgi:hypothetical protein
VAGIVPSKSIERDIVVIRGHRVMLSPDLAALYGLSRGSWFRRSSETLSGFPLISCSN